MMRTISKRLLKLEKAFTPLIEVETTWGTMAGVRDKLLRLAEQRGTSSVAQLKEELEAMGPNGFWLEAVRGYLSDHGFVQGPKESFAETICRALGIHGNQLMALMQNGGLGEALLNRFRETEIAADNCC